MLHNSGPYEPNDVPLNMGAPINNSQSVSPNFTNNLQSYGKISQENSSLPITEYNVQEYTAFGHNPSQKSSHISQFPSFSPRHVTHNSHQENSINSDQNGFLPFNFNYTNNSNHNYHSQFLNNPSEHEINNDFIHQDLNTKSAPLIVPNITTKTFNKANNVVNNSIQSFKYNITEKITVNSKKSQNNTQKSQSNETVPEKAVKIANSRTERIEKAVKHIENIIASDMLYRKQESKQKSVKNSNTTERKDFEVLYLSEDLNDREYESKVTAEDKKSRTEIKKEPNVTVTADNLLWTEIDYENPFPKDVNGVTKDKIDNVKIIDGSRSVLEASSNLKQTLQPSDSYYECPNCDLLFNHHKRFLVHVKWHSFGLTNMMRRKLVEAREMRRALNRGEVVEGNISEEYPCTECDKVFSRLSALKNHKTKCHRELNRQCRVCKLVLQDYKSFVDHQKHAHTTETGEFKCTKCDKLFKYSHTLAKHSALHDEKAHGCPLCPKRYGSQLLLKEHLRIHGRADREPSYHCSYCGKGFMDSHNLQSHERGHRNEKPFGCHICNTNFVTKSTLKRHLNVSHSTSKPHLCQKCHRSFSTAKIRDRHEIRAHADPSTFNYECKQCDCKYLNAMDLRKHVNKAHPKRKRKAKKLSDSE